ncbi:hypothetical protein HMPREF2892_09355 [Aerococcus sp. HMSC061A03]|nr:hypothetical protein HMPREF2892_09355 [Aerococcus sp. HMSC061A03]
MTYAQLWITINILLICPQACEEAWENLVTGGLVHLLVQKKSTIVKKKIEINLKKCLSQALVLW